MLTSYPGRPARSSRASILSNVRSRSITALRPSGVAEFNGRRVDVLSEGTLVEPGQWVKVLDVKNGHVIVRHVDRPPELGSIDTRDLNV